MKKIEFEKPMAEVIKLDYIDVLTTSGRSINNREVNAPEVEVPDGTNPYI